ncbi:MAG TPA: DUF72 domain-containing protein [Candidatus Aquabacterium excrementipullorum]|nr:DUF72 domain-containing protein [Candidatus Aquabacterium excrementipullorum]
MQDFLFPQDEAPTGPKPGPSPASARPNDAAPPTDKPRKPRPLGGVRAQIQEASVHALGHALPPGLRLGTSSWTYPGWSGLLWDGEVSESALSKHGLSAYTEHPLLRTVSLDRSFYRPLTAAQYARYAAQVPDDFRFMVKAPSLVTDALVRGEDGRGMQLNPVFLDKTLAAQEYVRPALDGLGRKLGVLVFQLSPLPPQWLHRLPEVWQRLGDMIAALPALSEAAPDAVIAVEVRDPQFITPEFADMLKRVGATYCLGLHPKLPPIDRQLPLLRKLWPGPLVCRWHVHRRHGPYGYADAEKLYAPFDTIHDDDPDTRQALARVIRATTGHGQSAYVTISNTAEGCAPRSILAMAREIVDPTPVQEEEAR